MRAAGLKPGTRFTERGPREPCALMEDKFPLCVKELGLFFPDAEEHRRTSTALMFEHDPGGGTRKFPETTFVAHGGSRVKAFNRATSRSHPGPPPRRGNRNSALPPCARRSGWGTQDEARLSAPPVARHEPPSSYRLRLPAEVEHSVPLDDESTRGEPNGFSKHNQ